MLDQFLWGHSSRVCDISCLNFKYLAINVSWMNGRLHAITALEINLRKKQLLVNIYQLFETLEKTRVTHSFLLLGEEQPHCVGCEAPFTVRHFFWSVAISHR